jgi:4-hydroxy-3-methylbut-2-enyl diphosphate reductase
LRVIVARSAGYCYGVRRATEMAFEAIRKEKGPIQSLGEVIHNPQVVAKLDGAGVRLVREVSGIGEGTAIIPAHGRAASDLKYLRERGIPIVDATCPHVRVPQRAVADLAQTSEVIVFLGDTGHPEVSAVASYADGARVVIVADIGGLPDLSGVRRAGVLAQTTQSVERFRALVEEMRRRVPDVAVRDTICSATRRRQEEAERLARESDAVIVVGGRLSANTNRLAEICRKSCRSVIHIESVEELDAASLAGLGVVGVTAGASTPDWVIAGVLESLGVEWRRDGAGEGD